MGSWLSCTSAYKLFQILISEDFEEEFLNASNQRKIIIELVLKKLQMEKNQENFECSNDKCKGKK